MMRVAAICVAAMVLAGCSSIKTYPNTLAKNMHVTTKLDSGSRVTSSSAVFDIYRVDAKCELTHEGRLDLDEAKKTEVGLPTNTLLYLEFVFSNYNYLMRHSSSTSYGLLLTPRPGSSYQAKVQYANGIYDATIREASGGDLAGHVITHVPLSACKART